MKLCYIRAQLASSLLVVLGRDRLFGKFVYAKEATGTIVEMNCCELLRIIVWLPATEDLSPKSSGSRLTVRLCQWPLKV